MWCQQHDCPDYQCAEWHDGTKESDRAEEVTATYDKVIETINQSITGIRAWLIMRGIKREDGKSGAEILFVIADNLERLLK
jgi:hypothetical protein